VSAESTSIETTITGVWREFFADAPVEPDSDFFGLGGDSVKMMDMLFRVSELTGVELNPGALYENPTLRQFAAVVAGSLEQTFA
jgi:acyl carrier protein